VNFLVRAKRVLRGSAFEPASIRVRDGIIAEIEPGEVPPSEGERVVDASGCVVLPALVDAHVHFREPGLEWKEGWGSGSRAAALGGVGTVLEVQNNEPLTTDLERLAERERRAASSSVVDFGLYANLLPDSLPHLRALASRCPGFKLFLGGGTGGEEVTDFGTVLALLEAAALAGRPVVAHCEESSVLRAGEERRGSSAPFDPSCARPAAAETVAVAGAIECAAATGAELHVFHVSAARTVDLLEDARARGIRVSASTCPHYLLFTDEDARKAGARLKVKPPIRSPADRERLRRGVRDGVIEVLTTDHAPHPRAEKEGDPERAPAGVPSVDLFLPLLLETSREAEISLATVLRAVTQAPARIFRLAGKGAIEPGNDADLVLLEEDVPFRVESSGLASRSGWSPYEGRLLRGRVRATYVRGAVAFPEGSARGRSVRLR
jgi:allantoinase